MTRLGSRLAIAALLALGLSGSGLLLQAQLLQEVGTWVPAGVGNARSNAATVVLSDGRTLIAGGRLADGTETDSVVIYDPVSGSTTSAGQLLIPRVGAAAAMLNDTSVVIIGGSMGDALTADVELLNLATGTSMLVGAMAEPRVNSAAARLPSGRVLIVGGSTVGGAALATAEIFDPTTYGVAPAGSLTTPRVGASATTLIDGRVLIAGGRNAAATELRSAEIYDSVAASAFTVLPTQMSASRAGHTAVLLPHNAGVLIAGGTSSGSPVASSDLFLPAIFPDPFSYGVGSFAPTGSMNAPRANAFAGPAGDGGYAFVSGGGGTARELYRYATIKTDKDDYAPGERALITGLGWQPNEEVHLLFQEDPAVHDDYELTVVADGAGNIRWDRWAPEQHDLNVRFYLMASGSRSRAQMTFTDSNPKNITVGPQGTNPVTAGGSTTYAIQVNFEGNSSPCTVSLSAAPVTTGGAPAWPAPPAGGFFSFAPTSVQGRGGSNAINPTSTLTVTTPAGMSANTYRFRVTATLAQQPGEACNGANQISTGDINLVVAAGAAAPVITEGASVTVNMTEDSTPTAFSLTLHATDANSDPLTWTISTPAGRGTAATTPGAGTSNVISYTPHPNYNGIDVFEVRVSDGTLTDTITVNVNIAAVNDEPSFVGSNRTVNEDAGPQSISSWATFDPGGESDEDTQTATYTVSGVSNPGLFSASPAVAPDGTLTFTSAANASGSSTFNVTVQDSGGTALGGDNTSPTLTYTITVTPVNDAPTFTALNPPTVNEDSGPHTVASWASFSPGGGANESSQTAIGYTVSNVANPALFTAGPAISPGGTLTYTLAANAFGMSTFDVTVQDNGGTANGGIDVSAVQSFTITVNAVNDKPSFTASNQTVNEDAGAQTITSWAAFNPGAANEAGQTATYSVTSISNPGLFVSGALPSVSSNGTLTFTTYPDTSGSSTFNVSVKDNGGTAHSGVDTSDTLTFTITVNPVNDAPSITANNPPAVNEDAGAQAITSWATFSPGGGTDEAGQTAIAYTISNISNASLFSTPPAVALNGTLTYTPAANANGTSTFDVTVQDSGGTANGGLDTSVVKTFTITVNAVNDEPSFDGSNRTVNEDAGLQTVSSWATFHPGGGADEATQTAAYTVSNVSNAALFSAQPAVAPDGTLTFTTALNASGSSTFDVVVKDSGGTANGGDDTSITKTFTITVNPVNDAPDFTAANPSTVNEDAPAQSITAWANFSPGGGADEASQTATYTVNVTSNPGLFAIAPAVSSSGTLTYTLAADANGTATFEVTVKDNGGTADGGVDTSATKPFTLIVNAVNDEPSFDGSNRTVNEDAGLQTVSSWATFHPGGGADEATQTAAYTVSNVSNAALFSAQPAVAPDGTLTFTTALNASGSSTFDVVVKDSGGTANGGDDTSITKTFTITVRPVNDAPSFSAANPPTVNEDAPAQSFSWVTSSSPGGGADEAGQTLAYTVSAVSNPGLFAIGPAVSPAGVLTYTLAPNANGTTTFKVKVQDNGGTAYGGIDTSADQEFTLVVNAVNDEPSFNGTDRTVNEDAGPQIVSSWASFEPGGGTDENSQTAAYTVSNVSNAALFSAQPAVAPDGTLTFTTALNASGSSTFDVYVQDSGGTANFGDDTSITKTFTITVRPVNDAPSFSAANPPTVNEDAPAQSFSWVTSSPGGGADEAGQTLAYTVSAVSNPGLFAIGPAVSPAGVLTYTLASNANGTTTFKVKVQDNGGTAYGGIDTSADQEFTLVVNAVNDEPSFIGSNQTVAEDAGAQSVATWASFNPGGGPDEGTQTATYTVGVVSNPGLFAVGAGPAVSPTGTLTYTPAANAFGSSTFQVTVQDSGGTLNSGDDTSATLTYTITVTGVNDAPANLSFSAAPASISEGASTSLTGSFTDVEGTDTHTVVINWGDGTLNTSISLAAGVLSIPATAHTYADDTPTNTAFDAYTITVTVTDSGTTQSPPYPIPVSTTTSVTVNNVAPTLSITLPADGALYPLGTPVTLTVPITDPGADTFTCSINWDDPASPAVETSSSTTKNCNKAHSFAQAGVYTIVITVNDDDQPGVTDTKTVMVIVYDPSAGFVTGGGTIWSPLGAFLPDPTLQGKANFGFVSKYQKGAKTPSGQTEFQFHAGNLNFHGDVYQWLVVSGAKAQYKGTGTLNNVPGYGFLLTATDGQLSGGGGVDRFRIKITTSGGVVVYDNNPGPGDDPDTNPGQNIQTGSIVIHAK